MKRKKSIQYILINNNLKIVKTSLIFSLSILLFLVSYLLYKDINSPKVAYINWQEVFNNFEMKIEYEKKFQSQLKYTQMELDSLSFQFQVMNNRWERDQKNILLKDSLSVMWKNIQNKLGQKEDFAGKIKEEYDSEIQTQLIQYSKDFAKDKKLNLLLGVMDDGFIIHADESFIYTKDLIKYINDRYNDK
ncbi:MAG: OmpH family outer membrane protein [Bacteroidia bacterium]